MSSGDEEWGVVDIGDISHPPQTLTGLIL